MSNARDKFYELLCENIANEGYQLKKSKGFFEKAKGDLKYGIQFSWDGRGGTTFLNGLNGIVELPEITKATKKLLAYELPVFLVQPNQSYFTQTYRFPQMYSRKLLELANGMKFKEMSAMPFEEKYPIAHIKNTVEIVSKFIKNEVIPFHNTYFDKKQIFDYYILNAEKKYKDKDFHNISYYVFPIKLMCKKFAFEEPDFIKNINLFTNQSMDDLWNIQSHDFKNMESLFNSLKW